MTAPAPRDAGPALDPRAVEAAAEALYGSEGQAIVLSLLPWSEQTPEVQAMYGRMAAIAVAAAAPILLAAERQRIAAGIEALPYPDTLEGRFVVDWQEGFDHAQAAAARIVEADPGTTAPTEGDDRG